MARRLKALEIAERRTRAAQLRRSGASWADIARELGYCSPSAATQDVRRALAQRLREQGEALDEWRLLETDHLDDLRRRAMAILVSAPPETQLKAIDRLVRIAERRSRLLGLDHSDEMDERRVEIEQESAELLIGALRAIFADLNVTMTPEARAVVGRHLRAITAGEVHA